MATVWGNISNHWRIGLDAIVSGTSVTLIVYGQSQAYGHNFSSSSVTLGGSWSGSHGYTFYSGYGQTVTKELYRRTVSYTGTRTYSASTSYWGGGYSSVSRTITTTSPTTPSWSGDFVTGTGKSITLKSGYTHDLSWSLKATDGSTKTGSITTGAGASYIWSPPDNLFSHVTNKDNVSITISVVTKHGSTTVGTRTKSGVLRAGSGLNPSIGGVTWTDTNTTVATNIGAFVQNVSLPKGVIYGEGGKHGASITARTLTVGGSSVTHNSAFPVGSSGTITASGQVTDSRGKTASKAQNFTVLPYTLPTVNTFSVQRTNSSGVAQEDGSHLRATLNFTISPLLVSTQRNRYSFQIHTRTLGGSWSSARTTVTGPLGEHNYNKSFQIGGGGIYPPEQVFEVRLTLSDNTGTSIERFVQVHQGGAPYVHFHESGGVGINKYWSQGALDVGPGGMFDNGERLGGYRISSRDASALPSTYPNGTSSFTANGAGWPYTWGTVLTVKGADNRGMQFNFHQSGGSGSMRHMVNTSGANSWGEWKHIITEDMAATQAVVNAGTSTTRYVSPATLANSDWIGQWAVLPETTIGAVSGWTINERYIRQIGRTISMRLRVQPTSAVSSQGRGDIANQIIATITDPSKRPLIHTSAGSGAQGKMHAFYINSNGEIRVTATIWGNGIDAGEEISTYITWPI